MGKSAKLVSSILISAKTSSAAIQEVFALRKRENWRTSIELLRRKAGYRSKGSASDVLSGRRRVGRKRLFELGRALGLSFAQLAVLELLLEAEKCRDAAARADIERRLKLARSALLMDDETKPYLDFAADPVFLARVLAVTGLSDTPRSEALICAFFAADSATRVRAALRELTAQGLLVREGRDYRVSQTITGGTSEQHALQATHAAGKALPVWYAKRDLAIYQASVITATSATYRGLLQELRHRLNEEQAKLLCFGETGDMLVNFNVQIYPTLPHKPGQTRRSAAK